VTAVHTFDRPPPPGFRGLDPDQRIRIYTRHLPHWRQPGATYFVTFRLADSLPEAKRAELANLRTFWERDHPEPRSERDWEEHAREMIGRVESWSDEGHGECYFREPRWADDLRDRLHQFQNQRYHLGCWVIMPNHCHAVLRPFESHDLEDLIGGMKGVVAHRINAALGQAGSIWQDECFDRIIRDTAHLERVIQYIGRNPLRARIPRSRWYRWFDPAWEAAGWRFEDV